MNNSIRFRDRAALVISIIILGLFGYFEWWALGHSTDAQVVLGLMTGLTNLVVFVAGYWVGSSKNSVSQAPKEPETGPDVSKSSVRVVALVALLAAGALLLAGHPAYAADRRPPVKALNCGFPHPDPGCQGGVTPDNPFSGILQFSVEDLNTAIDFASKPPILQNEIACFSMIRDGMEAIKGFSDMKGFGLATIYVIAVRVNALKQSIMTSGDCLAVCGRAESLVPVGLFTRIPIGVVPTMCSVLKAAG